WWRDGGRFRLHLSFHPGFFRRCFRSLGMLGHRIIVGGNDWLRVSLIHGRFLLADLASGLRLILQLLLTALHALAHPVAHASCVTQQTNRVQAKELCPPTWGRSKVSAARDQIILRGAASSPVQPAFESTNRYEKLCSI